MGANSTTGEGFGWEPAAASRLPGAPAVSRDAPAGRSGALSRPVAVSGQAAGARRIRARVSRAARGRALWTGGEGLHAFDGAEPSLPGSDHATPVEGGTGWGADTVHRRRARPTGGPLHRAGRQRDQGRAAGAKIGGRAAARIASGRAV